VKLGIGAVRRWKDHEAFPVEGGEGKKDLSGGKKLVSPMEEAEGSPWGANPH